MTNEMQAIRERLSEVRKQLLCLEAERTHLIARWDTLERARFEAEGQVTKLEPAALHRSVNKKPHREASAGSIRQRRDFSERLLNNLKRLGL